MNVGSTSGRGCIRRELNGRVAGGLIAGWSAAVLVGLCLADLGPLQFLDLPLGAYLAGLGALVGLVIIGVRLAPVD